MTQAVQQFNPDQTKLIRETVAKGTNDAEFRLFIEVCRYHGLNPFARQIYAVVRESNYTGRQLTIQTSIDGYRLLAERSGKYAGQIGPEWCGKDGKWVDVWLEDEPPMAARIGVLRKDFNQPTWGIAKYRSYVQTKKDNAPTTMWHKMPDTMLAKCAEALALRKAFPAEMSGIYTKEEMDQADNEHLPIVDASAHVSEEQPEPANSNPQPQQQQRAQAPARPQPPQPQPAKPANEQRTALILDNGPLDDPMVEARKDVLNAIYNDGKRRGLWTSTNAMAVYMTTALKRPADQPVLPSHLPNLSNDEIALVKSAVEAVKPATTGAGGGR